MNLRETYGKVLDGLHNRLYAREQQDIEGKLVMLQGRILDYHGQGNAEVASMLETTYSRELAKYAHVSTRAKYAAFSRWAQNWREDAGFAAGMNAAGYRKIDGVWYSADQLAAMKKAS
jgi:hypothetical protein